MAKLTIITKGLTASSYTLVEGWNTIGRVEGNSFQIAQQSISSRHCEVRLHGGQLLVRDLQSTNGTFVGGQRVNEAIVKLGQTLRLGDVELRFEGNEAGIPKIKILLESEKQLQPPPPPPPVAELAVPEKQFQILLVDDSQAFLELFGDLCTEYSGHAWKIHKANCADAALAHLRDTPMDLVVLDVNMPMLDGLQLLGIINRRYPGLKIVIMTGAASDSKRADSLANGAELFLEKPLSDEGIRSVFSVLNEMLSWQREGFTGALHRVSLQEIIQVQCIGRHSAVLEVRNPQTAGQIYIDSGEVVHAAVGSACGRPAFYQLLSLRGGYFQVTPFKAPPTRSIDTTWENLLMDAALAVDESGAKPGANAVSGFERK